MQRLLIGQRRRDGAGGFDASPVAAMTPDAPAIVSSTSLFSTRTIWNSAWRMNSAATVETCLDQQIAMEVAFAGPAKIYDRFGTLDPTEIAVIAPDEFIEKCTTPPAIHRYGRSMAERVQKLAAAIRDEYDGDTTQIWSTDDPKELLKRLKNLPGFGDQKARIFAALLGKQLDVRPSGWREAIGPYAEEGSFRSVADVVDPASLTRVRETKREIKAAKKAAAEKEVTDN